MATMSLGMISSGAPKFRASAPSFRSRGAQRGFLIAPGRSFRAFRTIRKLSPRSPRLSRLFSRRARVSTSAVAFTANPTLAVAMADPRFAREEDEDDVMRSSSTDEGDENRLVETMNAVLADIVDGQQFLKETGRTKARPMRRRALVVCLALNAFRDTVDETSGLRPTSSRLTRVPSSGFGRTAHLVSQISFGASSPKTPAVDSRSR